MGKKTTQTQTSQSGNYAYDYLKGAFAPTVASGNDAGSAIMTLLGMGGDPTAQQAAFQRYLDGSGYQFALDQGTRAITGTAAGRGLLNSGATLRAMSDYGQKTGMSFFDQYMNRLAQQQSSGMAGAGLIANAGQWSKSDGKSTQSSGIGGILGPILSLAAAIPTGGASLSAGAGGMGGITGGLGL